MNQTKGSHFTLVNCVGFERWHPKGKQAHLDRVDVHLSLIREVNKYILRFHSLGTSLLTTKDQPDPPAQMTKKQERKSTPPCAVAETPDISAYFTSTMVYN